MNNLGKSLLKETDDVYFSLIYFSLQTDTLYSSGVD